ncbi:flagellar biosynthetic protein FliO [Fusibacter paucivorans]|uniref:Flagellar biosynthetic protein FliO n=1 Tax=Fusibacter paucivorans TaxID=76009 RepID=A0ABS5PVA0_9FIRM|nr:flagellar biosynthetic protein FliO [Fusibacter paucivorans]MBS7528409.1 flagellar biosynthetic protein FliO [Fusibacter paucivorans]
MARLIFMPLIFNASDASNVSNYWFSIKYVAMVVIFIYLLWIFSKWLTNKNYISLKDRNIKVLDRTALSNDKYIVLVELENIFYLLGVDKNGITLIDKRDDLSTEMFLRSNRQENNDFAAILKSSIGKRKQKDNDADN